MTANELTTLATGYWPAATLIAAVELDLFDALGDMTTAADALASRLGTPADRLVPLLDALAATGLLAKSPAGYAIAEGVRPLLLRSSPTCMLDALRYNADLYRHWSNLAAVVRGDAQPAGRMQLGGDLAATRRFVLGMDAKARAFAPALAAALDLDDARTLLDVGSGPGTLTRHLLHSHPNLRATLLDLPPVLAVAEELWQADPARDRVELHPADYREGPIPGDFDAIVYAGALHQETPATAAALLRRLFQALRPQGKVFVIDLMLNHDRTSPPFSALFQLNMMLLRPGAQVFEANRVSFMLLAAGFREAHTRQIDGTPYTCLTAQRRD